MCSAARQDAAAEHWSVCARRHRTFGRGGIARLYDPRLSSTRRKLFDAAQAGSLTLYASAPLLAELHGVLGREKFAKHLQVRGLSATQMFDRIFVSWNQPDRWLRQVDTRWRAA